MMDEFRRLFPNDDRYSVLLNREDEGTFLAKAVFGTDIAESQVDLSVDEIPKWTDEGFPVELRRFTNALSVGFPGREKSIFTPFW
jgi:hypothetical protein